MKTERNDIKYLFTKAIEITNVHLYTLIEIGVILKEAKQISSKTIIISRYILKYMRPSTLHNLL